LQQQFRLFHWYVQATDSTPLFEAAAHGHLDILKLMLQRKADPSKKLVSHRSMTWQGRAVSNVQSLQEMCAHVQADC
jgi:ankyrin repeat protein